MNNKRLKLLFICLISGLSAQSQYQLSIEFIPQLKGIEYRNDHSDRSSALIEVQEVKRALFTFGYFESRTTLVQEDSSFMSISIQLGRQTQWYGVSLEKLDAESRSLIDEPRKKKLKPYSSKELTSLIESLLTHYENNGFPFTEIYLDDIRLKDDQLDANLYLDRGPYMKVDSLAIKGDGNLPKSFVKHMLSYRKDMAYNQRMVDDLDDQINSTGFLQTAKSSEVLFTKNQTILYIYPENRKVNRFDGIIGIQTDEIGEIKFNGHLLFDLRNSFKKGEEIFFEWRGPGNSSQRLKTSVVLPYLFQTPFWAQAQFELQRQDSSYLNTFSSIALRYSPKGIEHIQLKWEQYNSSSLREISNASFESYRAPFYGLEWKRDPFRNELFPQKGWMGKMDVQIGQRKSEGQTEDQIRYELAYQKFSNLGSGFILLNRIHAQGIFSPNYLENELIRLGGNSDLRGFREEQFFSSHSALARIEQRYLIAGGYLFLSVDGGWIEIPQAELNEIWCIGTAAGLGLLTQGGLFSISWAMGAQTESAYGKLGSMIHFGYSNQF